MLHEEWGEPTRPFRCGRQRVFFFLVNTIPASAAKIYYFACVRLAYWCKEVVGTLGYIDCVNPGCKFVVRHEMRSCEDGLTADPVVYPDGDLHHSAYCHPTPSVAVGSATRPDGKLVREADHTTPESGWECGREGESVGICRSCSVSIGECREGHKDTHNSDSLQGSMSNQRPTLRAGLQRRGVASPLLLVPRLYSNPLPLLRRSENLGKAPWTAQ